MDPLTGWLLVGVGGLVVTALFLGRGSAGRGQEQQLEVLASEGGTIMGPGLDSTFEGSVCCFRVGTGVMEIGHERWASGPVMLAQFVGPSGLGRFEIFPEGHAHAVAKRRQMEDLETGEAVFDDAFILQASDPERLRSFLSAEIRRAIAVDLSSSEGELHILVNGRVACVRKHARMESPDQLLLFYRACRVLFERLSGLSSQWDRADEARREVAAGAIELVELRQELLCEASCLVCGETLSADRVRRCPRCDTPHHEDCWSYNGGCALYGCRGPEV